jgi:hypothetical protein
MSAPADLQVNDAVSEERTSGRSDALSVRTSRYFSMTRDTARKVAG